MICEVNGKTFQNILHRDAVDSLLNFLLFQKGDMIREVNGKTFQNILHRDAVDFLLNCDTKLAISFQVYCILKSDFYLFSVQKLTRFIHQMEFPCLSDVASILITRSLHIIEEGCITYRRGGKGRRLCCLGGRT